MKYQLVRRPGGLIGCFQELPIVRLGAEDYDSHYTRISLSALTSDRQEESPSSVTFLILNVGSAT